MEKFDSIDKQLVYYLHRNARLPFSELAKRVHLSKQAVKRRVERLENQGVIRGYITLIDEAKLGFGEYDLWLQFGEITDKEKEKLIKFVEGSLDTYGATAYSLRWDLAVGIHARNINEFDSIWTNNLFPMFAPYLREYQISILTKLSVFPKKYLMKETKGKVEDAFVSLVLMDKVELDEKDKAILKVIDQNSRQHIYEIAEKVGCSEKTVREKIKKLEKIRIITGYRALIDPRKLGYSQFELFLKLKNSGKEEEKKFYGFCQQHPNIAIYMKCIGKWDLDIVIETETIDEFQDIVSTFRNKFSDYILGYDFALNKGDYKFSYYPKRLG